MKTIVVVLAVLAVAVAGPAPQPQPGPEPQPAAPSAQASSASDQESQASESVSKRGAARLTPVSGNSIVDNTVSSAPQSLQQLQPLQPQLTTYSSSQQQPQLTAYSSQPQPQPQQQPQQQPLYAPHPYSFVAPQHQPSFFQYQPSLPALPPLLHSKYHAPSKQHVLQYVPQPYFQVPQYQAPFMYLIPQPQPHQAQPHHAQPAAGQQHQQSAGQPEQAVHHPQQPQQYVMVLSAPAAAPAPVAASGFQYFNHPLLAQQPQQLITFYAGPQQGQVAQPQAHLHQPQHQLHHIQLTQPQQPQMHQPQTRFYPEQQQLVFQSPQAEGPSAQNDGPPHFVQKQQNNQGPVGLEAPAPPTPASLVGTYGARVQHQQQHQQPHQHAYKTIIKA